MANFGIKNIWKNTNSGSSVDTTNLVTTNTNQTISGLKTFSTLPQSSATPTNNNDLTTKTYVDSNYVNLTQTQTIVGVKTFLNTINTIGINNTSGDLSLNSSANIDCNNKRLINVSNPTANTDAANKSYVDTSIQNYYQWNVKVSKSDLTTSHANQWVHWTLTWTNSLIQGKVNYFMVKFNYNNVDYTGEFAINANSVSYKNASEVKTFKLVGSDGSYDDNEKYIYLQITWTNSNTFVLNLKTTDAISTNISFSMWKVSNLSTINNNG